MPHTSFSSVLLPQPLAPITPSASPFLTCSETESSTESRRLGRGLKPASTCSRIVCRGSSGIRNDFETESTSMSGASMGRGLYEFRGAGAHPLEDDRADRQDDHDFGQQIDVGEQAGRLP